MIKGKPGLPEVFVMGTTERREVRARLITRLFVGASVALCLGAKAVGLGRPFLYGNGTYGQEGVEKVIQSMYYSFKISTAHACRGLLTDLCCRPVQSWKRRSRRRCGCWVARAWTSSSRGWSGSWRGMQRPGTVEDRERERGGRKERVSYGMTCCTLLSVGGCVRFTLPTFQASDDLGTTKRHPSRTPVSLLLLVLCEDLDDPGHLSLVASALNLLVGPGADPDVGRYARGAHLDR